MTLKMKKNEKNEKMKKNEKNENEKKRPLHLS